MKTIKDSKMKVIDEKIIEKRQNGPFIETVSRVRLYNPEPEFTPVREEKDG